MTPFPGPRSVLVLDGCGIHHTLEVQTAVQAVGGIVIFSRRSRAIAAWLTGIDLAFVSAVLESREILLEVGLDTQYLLARMRTPIQTSEAETFEDTKRRTKGLHFLSVQSGPEATEPEALWLLRHE